MLVRIFILSMILSPLFLAGCAGMRPVAEAEPEMKTAHAMFVPGDNDEAMWERTIDVVHNYFDIARENKMDGVIETQPKVGASLFEPWHRDATGFHNRLEGTMQSIRRRAFINIRRENGGYMVSVEVLKELEDLPGLAANAPGAATFQTSNPLQRDLNLVVGQTSPSGWIAVGRDTALEQRMIAALEREFSTP